MPSNSSTMVVTTQIIKFFLFILLSLSFADADDKSAMTDLINSFVTSPPSGWDPQTSYCTWKGVNCDIPSQRVTYINIPNQELNSTLPSSFNKLTQLINLNLQNNHFSGPLPNFSNLSNLQNLYLDNNKFSGEIPDLSGCTQISDLQLSENEFTGIVPVSVVNLPKLQNVKLENNKLQGPMPVFRANLTHVSVGDNESTNSYCRDTPGECDPQVLTLLEIAAGFGYPLKLAESWKGNDACNSWTFVNCDANKKVIAVNFAEQGFSGVISPAFGELTSLTGLLLNDNNLTGSIPQELATLPKLKKLDVSNNDLSGKIPSFGPGVSFLYAGNKKFGKDLPAPGGYSGGSGLSLSGSGGGSKGFKVSIGMVAGVVITVLAFIAVVIFVSYKCYMKKKMLQVKLREELEKALSLLAPEFPVKFTYESLMAATRNFDLQNKLGVGGFGSVFKGNLRNGTNIAVKRLDNVGQGEKEFIAEVKTLGSLHHVNLVNLVGFCAENKQRLLVYEFLGNGSLDKWIFTSKRRRGSLNWEAKRKVILQIAKGLAYLHEDCQKRIAHLDVKPQNVLLDDAFNAKLSDFGLAKLIDRDQSHTMTQMRGTRGYLAPEWLGRKITERVDVYSYGVVALEVVFERKNLDYSQPEESSLLHTVKQKVEESQLIDLLNLCSEDMQQYSEDVEKIVKLALRCLQSDPLQRPPMSMIVKVLEGGMGLEAVDDYTSGILTMDENTASEAMTTPLSASVLSGPR